MARLYTIVHSAGRSLVYTSHRKQKLFFLVAAPLATDARAGYPVRGGSPPILRRRQSRSISRIQPQRQGALPGGRSACRVGFAGNYRIPGGGTSRRMAGG